MATKIKGHRIDDKAISNKHMADDFKVSEGTTHIQLNYSTHSNANDLSTVQKQILTMGGNADSLHFHSGGGGGVEGIYTHQQIDTAILQIMMNLNAKRFNLQHSLFDLFDDATGIDHGIAAPAIIVSSEITSSTDAASLNSSSTYFYRVAQKYKNNISHASVPFRVQTSDTVTAPYKKVRLSLSLIPDNEGIKVWRALADNIISVADFEKYNTLYSPQSLDAEIIPEQESLFQAPTLKVDYLGTSIKDSAQINVLSTTVGAVSIGDTLNVAITTKPVVKYAVKTSLPHEVRVLQLVWDNNPALVPTDYIIEYSTISNPDANKDSDWQPILDLQKQIFTASQQTATNGVISQGSTISGNTNIVNNFVFKKRKISGIRVTVTGMLGGVRLNTFAAMYLGASVGQSVIQQMPTDNIDVSKYKSLLIDVESDMPPNNLSLTLLKSQDIDTSATGVSSIYSLSNQNTSIGAASNRIYRCRCNIGSRSNDSLTYSRIRLKFYKAATAKTRLTNVTVGFNTSSGTDSLIFLSKVTFNGGQDFYEDTTNGVGYFYSDWIPVIFPPNYNYVITSFCIESGVLYGYGSDSNQYTWYNDNNLNNVWDMGATGIWTAYQANYTYVHGIELAKSAYNFKLEGLPSVYNKPYTHIIDVSSLSDIVSLKGIAYNVDSAVESGQALFANPRFSNIIELTKGTTIIPNANCTATSNTGNAYLAKDGSIANSWQSGSIPTILNKEAIMFKFNAEYLVSRVRLVENTGSDIYTLESYTIQYTNSDTALVTDDIDSVNWNNVPNLRLMNAEHYGFTGNIYDGKVTNNNLHQVYLDHTFDNVVCKAIRIVIHKTKGNTVAHIYDAKIYTADVPYDFSLIYESSSVEDIAREIIDDGAVGFLDVPQITNTTGSYNILHDAVNGYVKVFDKTEPGVFVSNTVDTGDLFLKYLVSVQQINNNGSTYYISNDDGVTWSQVTTESVGTIALPGAKFKFKAVLNGDDILSAYSVLYSL